uniref:Uncharacterized protein n=1 Tax=Nomascus leucogenys TaxID=61853 RepID=G1RAD2_NOMLE
MRQEVEVTGRGSHELVITDERWGVCGGSLSCIVYLGDRARLRLKKKKKKKYTWPGPTRDSRNASLQPGRAKFAFSHASHTPLHPQLGELQTGKPQAFRSMGPHDHHVTTLILISLYTPLPPGLKQSYCFSLPSKWNYSHTLLCPCWDYRCESLCLACKHFKRRVLE